MGKYIARSLKYLVKLLILLTVIMLLMLWSGTSTLSFTNFFADFIARPQTWLLLAVVVVWSAIYPKVEFVTRTTEGNLREDKIGIINAMRAGGMSLADESEGRMKFHGEAPVRRVWWLGDDTVTLTQESDGLISIEGPRRFAGEAQTRIPGYIEREKVNGNQ